MNSNTDYFRNIPSELEALGYRVYVSRVPPFGSIEERGVALSREVSAIAGDVAIIAHSMGGLDSRYFLSVPQNALTPNVYGTARVKSLTTICTPHYGSYFATWAMNKLGKNLGAEKVLDTLSIPYPCFRQLTCDYMNNNFNPRVIDNPAVLYQSYGAFKPLREVSLPLQPSHSIIYHGGLTRTDKTHAQGDNDGLCSVSSSKWGTYVETLYADHWDVINWGIAHAPVSHFNAVDFYKSLAFKLTSL
jgi:triacylglycerol lipase